MNMGMTVRKVADPAFKAYGRVITGYDFSGLLKAMEHTPLPEDVIYIPSLPEMEALSDAKELERGIYGQMPIQIGCCNGHNKKLNAVEYHRDSEVDIAVDDLILILGNSRILRKTIHTIHPGWRHFWFLREPRWRYMPQPCTMRPAM